MTLHKILLDFITQDFTQNSCSDSVSLCLSSCAIWPVHNKTNIAS